MRDFLKEKKLKLLKKLSKGFSSNVFLVENEKNEKFALKIEKAKSRRKHMVEKEVSNLKLANSARIGPKLLDFDLNKRIVLMEFIEGKTFNEWIFKTIPSKKDLEKVIESLFEQAKKLDEIGLDHGQICRKGKNILIKKNLEPVIIDFEKASIVRKPHNKKVLDSFFFNSPKSAIVKKISETLETEKLEKLKNIN